MKVEDINVGRALPAKVDSAGDARPRRNVQGPVMACMAMPATPCPEAPGTGSRTCPCPPEARAPKSGSCNLNPPDLSLPVLLLEDLRTHGGHLFEQGFWAVAVHRFGNWRIGVRPRVLRFPLTFLYRFLFKWVQWTCGITLPYTTRLGRRVRLWHHGGMVLHAQSIGDDVHIRQNTTFGIARRNRRGELPVIEDRADVGCGACILGAVTVGRDSVIGANSVVLSDVPPGSVAVGAPARIVERGAGTSSSSQHAWQLHRNVA